MENVEGIDIPTDSEISEVKRRYESYSGVCDVLKPEESFAMAEELENNCEDPDRRVMIGVMAGHFSMNPQEGGPEADEERGVFPTREAMSGGFIGHRRALNTIHFADLYRPKEAIEQSLENDLELVVQYGGEHLHAIQLDVTWPNPDVIDRFKAEHPELKIILQVGRFAIEEAGNDPQKVVEMLDKYGDSIDYALLDMSMGKGRGMEAGGLLPLLRLLRKELPGLGLAVAGGLGPDSVDLLGPIVEEFGEDISFDAQGRLKPEGAPVDALGHMIATVPADLERAKTYIRKSCELLYKRQGRPNLSIDNSSNST